MVNKIRHILWLKTWYLYLVKLWSSHNLGRLKLKFGKKNQIVEVLNQTSVGEHVKFAVVVLFPVRHPIYDVSIRNLISALRSNDLHIILMLNGPVTTPLKAFFIKENCTIITRKNVGRDFGAYKDGIMWLEREVGLEKIERLLLTNDTLLWMNDGTEHIAKTLKSDWSSLFLNLEIHTHAQSFFLSFSNDVLRNKKVIKFWRQYVPTKHRRLTILKGEIKLSEVLIKEGFRCKAVVNESFVSSLNQEAEWSFTQLRLLGSLQLSEMAGITPPGVTPGRKLPMTEMKDILAVEIAQNEFEISDQIIKQNLIDLFSKHCNSHAPHRIGLQLYVLYGFPLKTDLYKCYTLSDLNRCVQLKNPEYADESLDFFGGKSQQFMEGSRKNIKRRRLGEI